MAKKEKLVTLAQGAVAGIVIAVAVAFGAGWVVTSGARDVQVRTAAIDAQAEVCASLVVAYRQDQAERESLAGFRARDARNALAADHVVILAGAEAADPDVVAACARLLDRADI